MAKNKAIVSVTVGFMLFITQKEHMEVGSYNITISGSNHAIMALI